ncbi:hypothetical protein [Vibrio mediterranei]|uniref:hypothetical protein n=1 Tax=Vibrio mediterranei TaxID=689 RepID=UPI002283B92B|nr:hypothetical protein [Vibrio mediterranei]MCY9853174.1 hypothetical protein [Vibrio mediterranei]
MKYWTIDPLTKEVIGEYDAQSKWNIPRNAMTEQPLLKKQGFAVVAVFDGTGNAIDSEYIEDHRGMTIHDESDCTKSELVSELGPIKEGFTPDKPLTIFDERIDGMWVTNERNKYIAEYDQVDSARRAAYREVSDPLYMEAWRKESKGLLDEAAAFRQQADAAVELIQTENPWPTTPEV